MTVALFDISIYYFFARIHCAKVGVVFMRHESRAFLGIHFTAFRRRFSHESFGRL